MATACPQVSEHGEGLQWILKGRRMRRFLSKNRCQKHPKRLWGRIISQSLIKRRKSRGKQQDKPHHKYISLRKLLLADSLLEQITILLFLQTSAKSCSQPLHSYQISCKSHFRLANYQTSDQCAVPWRLLLCLQVPDLSSKNVLQSPWKIHFLHNSPHYLFMTVILNSGSPSFPQAGA